MRHCVGSSPASLRPASLDSPTRCRPCTFREFAFLFLLFIVSLISGPVAILLFGYNLSWDVWMGATLLLLALSQVVFYLPCQLHVRWCRRRPWCYCCARRLGLGGEEASQAAEELHHRRPWRTRSPQRDLADIKTTVCTGFPTKGVVTNTQARRGRRAYGNGEASNAYGGKGMAWPSRSCQLRTGESRELLFWAVPSCTGEDMVVYRPHIACAAPAKNVDRQHHSASADETTCVMPPSCQRLSPDLRPSRRWRVWEEKIAA